MSLMPSGIGKSQAHPPTSWRSTLRANTKQRTHLAKGQLEIDTSAQNKHEPLLVVFSDDQSSEKAERGTG